VRCPDNLIPFLRELATKLKNKKKATGAISRGFRGFRGKWGNKYNRGNRQIATYKPKTNMMTDDYQGEDEQEEEDELTEDELKYLE
jgi:hypothetical protein